MRTFQGAPMPAMTLVLYQFSEAWSTIARLRFRNRRFQNVPFRSKRQSIYDRKTPFFAISVAFATDEYKHRHSSTNSSTRTHQISVRLGSASNRTQLMPRRLRGFCNTNPPIWRCRVVRSNESGSRDSHARCAKCKRREPD